MGGHLFDLGSGNAQFFCGALQDIAVVCIETMPSENSIICTSYVPGMVTVKKGKAFNDN